MADKVTVVCPHCGSTGTYNNSIKTGDGQIWAQCISCHKSFKVEIHGGQVYRVMK